MRYASSTDVSSDKSRSEIERILQRYGADQFMYGWQNDSAVVAFRANDRRVRFILPLPARNNREFTHHSCGMRTADAAARAYEQAVRQRWRALALVIKAKLEAVESGISEFEDEFLANIMLPTGETVGEWMKPQVAEAYRVGTMPPLLPMLPAPEQVDA
jgi:diphthamide synthase (EF-2-diphthine--ammonia ligase)